MRTELEKKLAILTFQAERKVVQMITMFGDNNHTIIDYSIDVINGKYNSNDLWDLEEEGVLTEGERSTIDEICNWLEGDIELVDLLWNEENLVTELPEVEPPKSIMCEKQCKECPFSKNSLKGWLATYNAMDLNDMMNAEASFPCHLQMTSGDMNSDETKEAIERGEMKLCRGYVESMIKSCKMPRHNQQLIDVINKIKSEGSIGENSMDIFEFLQHHDPKQFEKLKG